MGFRSRLEGWVERQLAAEAANVMEESSTTSAPPLAAMLGEAEKLSARVGQIEARDLRWRAAVAGYTDEGLARLKAYADANGMDPLEAVAAFEIANPPVELVMGGGGRYAGLSRPKAPDVPLDVLMKDPFGEDFLNQSISVALAEARGQR